MYLQKIITFWDILFQSIAAKSSFTQQKGEIKRYFWENYKYLHMNLSNFAPNWPKRTVEVPKTIYI